MPSAPPLTVEVRFLGPAEIEHLQRTAQVSYRSRKNSGFLFRSHRSREDTAPITVAGTQLRLVVPKQTYEGGDVYDLEGLSLRYETERDRRFGFAPTTLGFYPSDETWVPKQWPSQTEAGKLYVTGFFYEHTADGVYRTRRRVVDGQDMPSIYFSSLADIWRLDVTLDFTPWPAFDRMTLLPDTELGGPSDALGERMGVQLRLQKPTQARELKARVLAVAPGLGLPFWDGQQVFDFSGDWTVMRATDLTDWEAKFPDRRGDVRDVQASFEAERVTVKWRYTPAAPKPVTFFIAIEEEGRVYGRARR